jgi:hypothetical protein
MRSIAAVPFVQKFIRTVQALLLAALFGLPGPTVAAIAKTDFDGDGRADLLLGNIFSGRLRAWLSDGTTIAARPSYGGIDPATGWGIFAVRDADGDGRTDLYWYRKSTGAVATQLVQGTTRSTRVIHGRKSPTEGWTPMGLGDTNGDGKYDIYWLNIYSGAVEVWTLGGTSILQKLTLGTLPPSQGWSAIGLRDLNLDGRTDVLLYNPYTGGLGAWIAGTVAAPYYGVASPSQGWTPIGFEDFDGDGRADVLWYNVYSGLISVWLIAGGVLADSVDLGLLDPSTGWTLAGLADLNGDERTDIL